jgi:ABC-type multidrug transport system fused ATPase/permease subunit
VTLNSYKELLNYSGGWKLLLFLNFALWIKTYSETMISYKIGEWGHNENLQKENYNEFTLTLISLAFMSAIAIFTRSMFVTCMTYTAGKKIHREMLQHVLNAPINLFFDVTPTGLIVNRFSKDISTIEGIFMTIMWIHVCAYQVISIIVVIILANWYLLLIFPFMLYYLVKIYKFTIGSYCELNRLNSVTKTPILSHLGESISGNSTIRAFGKQKQFLEINYKDINNNILVQ